MTAPPNDEWVSRRTAPYRGPRRLSRLLSSWSPDSMISTALNAVIRRDVTTMLYNRYLQVFALLLLGGSVAVVGTTETAAPTTFGMLLLFLYVIPLFATLIGVHVAQEELEEHDLLFSHPLSYGTFVGGKLVTLVGALVAVLTVSLVPVVARVASARPIGILWGLGMALILIWSSTGLAIGAVTSRRTRGLVTALCVWFGSLVLYDLAAFALSGVEAVRAWPSVWVGILLLNPADAVRLAGMTALQEVSFTAPGSSTSVAQLLAWTPAWVAVLTVLWTGAALITARRALTPK